MVSELKKWKFCIPILIILVLIGVGPVTAAVYLSFTLTPVNDATCGNTHTVTATLSSGVPITGQVITFSVIAGPNAGQTGTAITDKNGAATWTYTSNTVTGTDSIQAQWYSQTSNSVYKTWGTCVPEFPSAILPAIMIIGFLGAVLLIQRTREH
jgi:hypothetical protein